MGKKHFCFFQTAETGNRTPNSGVKGSGANHYPRAPAHIKVKTSAFWTFVEVFLQYNKNANTVIEIQIKSSNLTGKITDCVHNHDDEDKIYITKTSSYHKNVVCSSVVGVEDINRHAVLFVNSFHYYGPNRLTQQSFLCEYGGLYIKFEFSDGGFEFCQDINNLNIHSKHNYIGITLIWFHGYTEGYFWEISYFLIVKYSILKVILHIKFTKVIFSPKRRIIPIVTM